LVFYIFYIFLTFIEKIQMKKKFLKFAALGAVFIGSFSTAQKENARTE